MLAAWRTRRTNIYIIQGGIEIHHRSYLIVLPGPSGAFTMHRYGKTIPLEAQFAYRQAVELSRRGNYEVAYQRLKQVVTIAPSFAKAFNEMGSCLVLMGRDTEALSKFEKALIADPCNQ